MRPNRWSWMLLLLAVALAACRHSGPEERLRQQVDALQAAIESRDAGDLDDLLAADFSGPGGMSRDEARRLALAMFLRHQDVGVTLGPLEVELLGSRANVSCDAVLTGGSGALLPDAARVYRVRMGWREVDGEWLLTGADWDAGDQPR